MLKTIRGGDGKPYISLEDFMSEVKETIEDLEEKLTTDNDDNDDNDSIEDRIDFLEKLYGSLKTTESEYYKKILGM